MDKKVMIFANSQPGMDRDAGLERMLLENGFEVCRRVVPLHDPQAIVEGGAGFPVVLCADEYWSEETIMALRGTLRAICRLGSGVDNIDIAGASRAGVAVTRTIGSNASAVAELCAAYILTMQRRIIATDKSVRAGDWHGRYTNELSAMTVGLVGSGHIGKIVVSMLKGFGCAFLVHDLVRDDEWAASMGVRYVGLDELVRTADILSLHVPLNDSTKHMVDARFLAKMKPSALLVNTSRGRVINEADLYAALSSGVIAGAALDVFEDEPTPPDNPLLTLDNVIAGCHCGAATFQTRERNAAAGFRNICELYAGRGAQVAFNPDYVEHLL